MRLKGSTIAIVFLSVALVLSAFVECGREMRWLIKPNDPHRNLMLEGYAIYIGLLLYAEKNGGQLPRSLEELKPDYVGSIIDLTGYRFLCPGQPMWRMWGPAPPLQVVQTRHVAEKVVKTPEGNVTLVIYGHGEVAVYLPGQLED